MTQEIKTRTCLKCKQKKPLLDFPYTNSKFFPQNHPLICTSCFETLIKSDDLNSVDRLMRHLDLPFNPDIWTRLYEHNGNQTLTAYLNTISDSQYEAQTWAEENAKWAEARELKTAVNAIKVIDKAKLTKMRHDWSPEYSDEDLYFLETFFQQLLLTQNVSTPLDEAAVRDLCELELRIKKGLRAGVDVKKDLDARNDIIKVHKLDAANSKNAADFESIGELMTYCVRQGWHPNWHTEPQDSVDFTMNNIQHFLTRLVNNEGNFAEQVEDKRESFEISQRLEDNDEDTFRQYDETDSAVVYEDEDKLAGDLSDWDIK